VRLRKEIAEAGRALAAAVRKGQAGSPEIDAALTRLNAAQAELQRATLDHFFAMKDHLEPDQAEKLLEWTHDSLLPD
jgi:Spy/CpxP family protein refolding chaperone